MKLWDVTQCGGTLGDEGLTVHALSKRQFYKPYVHVSIIHHSLFWNEDMPLGQTIEYRYSYFNLIPHNNWSSFPSIYLRNKIIFC